MRVKAHDERVNLRFALLRLHLRVLKVGTLESQLRPIKRIQRAELEKPNGAR